MVIVGEFQYPESPVLFEQRDTRAVLDNKDLGLGTVYVSERTLCWKEHGNVGFSIEYPHISMHAITTDPQVYASECVFIMIDGHITIPGFGPVNGQVPPNEQHNEDDDDTDSEPNISQLILVPPDQNAIRLIYNALSQCQVLNPDPEDIAEEDDNVYEDAEDFDDELPSHARLNDVAAGGDTEMNHLLVQLENQSLQTNNYTFGNGDQNFDDEQFEDAD